MIATSSICQCACGRCSAERGGYAGIADRYRRCCHSGYARAIQRSTKHVSGVHDRAPNALTWSTSILMMAPDNLSNVQQAISLSAKTKSAYSGTDPSLWAPNVEHCCFQAAALSHEQVLCISIARISSRTTCRARSLREKPQAFWGNKAVRQNCAGPLAS